MDALKRSRYAYLSRRAGVMLGVLSFSLLAALAVIWLLGLRRGRFYLPAAATAVVGALLAAGYFWLYRPYRETERVLELFARGYTMEGIYEVRNPPSPATQEAVERVQQLLNTDSLMAASKRQAQYLALQNQINPHFLYNTLEGIRSDALVAGLDNVAQMTEALSTFFRYTISNLEHLVTLEEELANVQNYFLIQQYRFGERLQLEVLFDNEEDRRQLLQGMLPKLTLQPIVENAIIHGLEGKVGKGLVTIRIRGTADRMLVAVCDDGLGMDGGTLDSLHEKLNTVYYDYIRPDTEKQGGIALVNVNNRIRLLFGEAYGIVVYSTPGRGTDVAITLPYTGRRDASSPSEKAVAG